MRRRMLFEIADQRWCPAVVRDGVTDYLAAAIEAGGVYSPAVPLLSRLLDATGASHIIDLASGAGGPWRSLLPQLDDQGRTVTVTVTDHAPNQKAFACLGAVTANRVHGDARRIDARCPPADLSGVRTIFSALHHFTPSDVRRMLAESMRQGRALGAFEATHRSTRALALTCLVPLLVWLLTPRIRPLRASRLLLTYLVPVIPLVAWFDGMVSCLRTFSPAELEQLAREASADAHHDGPPFRWETGEVGSGPIPVTYLLGWPET